MKTTEAAASVASNLATAMAGWMKIQDATWYEGRPRPRPHYVRWEHSPPHERGTTLFSERELTFTFAICYRPSVCLSSVCLSSVCL